MHAKRSVAVTFAPWYISAKLNGRVEIGAAVGVVPQGTGMSVSNKTLMLLGTVAGIISAVVAAISFLQPQNSSGTRDRSIAPNFGVSLGPGVHIEQNSIGNNSPNIISGRNVNIENNNR